MPFDLDPNYKQVPERIADLKEKFPDARLQPTDPARPFWIETVPVTDENGEVYHRTFVVYSAACYRDANDTKPGIGTAWEPFPGRTPYTKDSELMNAETSAWGRAIIATLASESKAIASAEEARNRQAEAAEGDRPRQKGHNGPSVGFGITDAQAKLLNNLLYRTGFDTFDLHQQGVIEREVVAVPDLNKAEASKAIDWLSAKEAEQKGTAPAASDGPSDAQLRAISSLQKKCELSDAEVLTLAGVSALTELTPGRNGTASALITKLQDSLGDPESSDRPF